MPASWRNGAIGVPPSFNGQRVNLRAATIAVFVADKRTTAHRNRLLLTRARHDTRVWQVKRCERTHQLIELGGLVAKAGLIELTDDDRAVIFGALLEMAAQLRGDDREQAFLLWRRRGKRAFGLVDEPAIDG